MQSDRLAYAIESASRIILVGDARPVAETIDKYVIWAIATAAILDWETHKK